MLGGPCHPCAACVKCHLCCHAIVGRASVLLMGAQVVTADFMAGELHGLCARVSLSATRRWK
jgi:hypothetical protein